MPQITYHQNKQNKILFIAHSNNDLDHYLPIIQGLCATENYKPYILFLYSKKDVTNEIHKQIINELPVNQFSYNILFKYRFIINTLFGLNRFLLRQVIGRNTRDFLYYFRVDLLIMKFCIKIINLILNQLKTILFPVKKFSEFLKSHSFSMVILDLQKLTSDLAKRDLLKYTLYHLVLESKFLSIPTFMISHGAVTYYSKSEASKQEHHNSALTPDVLTLCYKNEKNILQHLIGPKTDVKFLGDTRYDSSWIEKLENISRMKNIITKTRGKYIVLVITRSFYNTNNPTLARTHVHNDILKLLDDYNDIELWFKAHPRYPATLNVKPNERVRVFYNATDSSYLLGLADLIISPTSGVLFHPITKGRRVIYYDIWKKYCPDDAWTVFDDTKCVYKASNYDELKKGVLTLRRNQLIKEEDVNKFYKAYISGGITLKESIVERHINAISKTLLTFKGYSPNTT